MKVDTVLCLEGVSIPMNPDEGVLEGRRVVIEAVGSSEGVPRPVVYSGAQDIVSLTAAEFIEALASNYDFAGAPLLVKGNIKFSRTGRDLIHAFSNLSSSVEVQGDVEIRICDHLTKLPEKLNIFGDLYIQLCDNLSSIPEKLSVTGSLFIHSCNGFVTLSLNIIVHKLCISCCDNLTEISGNIAVVEFINIHHCIGLTLLSANLSSDGDLRLSECRQLEKISGAITTKGDLDIGFCGTSDVNATVGGRKSINPYS